VADEKRIAYRRRLSEGQAASGEASSSPRRAARGSGDSVRRAGGTRTGQRGEFSPRHPRPYRLQM